MKLQESAVVGEHGNDVAALPMDRAVKDFGAVDPPGKKLRFDIVFAGSDHERWCVSEGRASLDTVWQVAEGSPRVPHRRTISGFLHRAFDAISIVG